MNRIDICSARLGIEEGRKPFAYNDKTGKRVTCRTADPTTSGNLSIAVGLNLETGLDNEEIDWLLAHRLTKTDTTLRAYAWYPALDEPRGSVFLDLGFNDGVTGLLHFTDTIHFASIGDWPSCSAALLDSLAAKELPSRYDPFSKIILSGVP